MKKKEIESKFDEIVAFSEIERFIDTPVACMFASHSP
jgi:ABC-type polysaccharide/polyol phosphate transport system ATPase subunit